MKIDEITPRDLFALVAAAGACANAVRYDPATVARDAYDLADALLEARKAPRSDFFEGVPV